MIIPINGHVVIEPVKHEEFMSSVRETFDEIGVVMQIADTISNSDHAVKIGQKVYFDSWMASKFPKGDGTHYWLVPFSNIKAYESLPE